MALTTDPLGEQDARADELDPGWEYLTAYKTRWGPTWRDSRPVDAPIGYAHKCIRCYQAYRHDGACAGCPTCPQCREDA